MLSRETNFHRRTLFWPQFTQYCRIWWATLWERFLPNGLNGWTGLPWMKAITIDRLNICIFSFVSFSSVAVMLIPRGTPYRIFIDLGHHQIHQTGWRMYLSTKRTLLLLKLFVHQVRNCIMCAKVELGRRRPRRKKCAVGAELCEPRQNTISVSSSLPSCWRNDGLSRPFRPKIFKWSIQDQAGDYPGGLDNLCEKSERENDRFDIHSCLEKFQPWHTRRHWI
jgi:hypothetical protein